MRRACASVRGRVTRIDDAEPNQDAVTLTLSDRTAVRARWALDTTHLFASDAPTAEWLCMHALCLSHASLHGMCSRVPEWPFQVDLGVVTRSYSM